MLKLYEHPLSPYAQKVKIALEEKGIPCAPALPTVFVSAPVCEPRAPPGEVPCLIDGGVVVFISTIFPKSPGKRGPNPPLLPPDPAERARVRMLEELCDTYY